MECHQLPELSTIESAATLLSCIDMNESETDSISHIKMCALQYKDLPGDLRVPRSLRALQQTLRMQSCSLSLQRHVPHVPLWPS